MPTPNELHVDRYLTNLSVSFAQDSRDFIHDKVFPVVPVRKASDKYVIFNRGDYWRDQMAERPLGGRADVAEWSKTEGTYLCVERALAYKVDDRVVQNADDPISVRREAMELLMSQTMVNNDVRWAATYMAPSIWTTDLEGAADADFTQVAYPNTGDPMALIDEYKEVVKKLTAVTPNKLVLGARAYRVFRNHDKLKDVFKYTRAGIIDADLIAAALGVDQVLIPRSVYNTAVEGATDSFDFVAADNDALLVYAAPRPGLNTPSAGYTFAWTGLLPGVTNAMGGVIMTGRDDFAHSDHYEIRTATDIKLVSADLGVYFNTIVAATA